MTRQTLMPAVVFCSLALVPGPSHAAPACGETVGGPDQTVVLDGNVGPCPGDGLIVAEGTIAIDLAGFTVSCDPMSADPLTVGIDGANNAVEIRGGTVTGCDHGISGGGGNGMRIVDMTLDGNVYGFLGDECVDSIAINNFQGGMYLHDGESSGCQANGNQGVGIMVAGIGGVSLRDSSASSNDGDGIYVSSGARLAGLTATGNGGSGITIATQAANRVRLDGFVADDNTLHGVAKVSQNRKTRIRGGSAAGNGGDGIHLASKADAKGNTTTNNVGAGIRVEAGGDGSKIRLNTASGNATDLVDEQAGCGSNKWRNNTFVTSDPSDCID